MLTKYKLKEIKNIEEIQYCGDVYDLTIEDDNSYCVNDNYIVHNCSDVAHGLDALICADGGITCPGDIAKAFGANADFVMIGTMFAGTDQCEGDIITKWEHDGTYTWDTSKEAYNKPTWEPNVVEKKYKQFYGMSSDVAPGNAGKNKDYRTSEGIVSEVPYKGDVNAIIMDILGGLRSACTYIGARNLKSFGKCATFQRVNNQK